MLLVQVASYGAECIWYSLSPQSPTKMQPIEKHISGPQYTLYALSPALLEKATNCEGVLSRFAV